MPIFKGLAVSLADLREIRRRILHRIEEIFDTPTSDSGRSKAVGRVNELQSQVRELDSEIALKERTGDPEVVSQPRAKA